MLEPNTAQQILIACGVDAQRLFLGHLVERSRSFTKKGPGRIHQQGRKMMKEEK